MEAIIELKWKIEDRGRWMWIVLGGKIDELRRRCVYFVDDHVLRHPISIVRGDWIQFPDDGVLGIIAWMTMIALFLGWVHRD